ncbi:MULTISPECIES: hypothetical protein [unclassified Duganella]|uniref:hypothetical protein n=1 Tax=unclassified Duganella TaxID=2636909 RepID=UPI0008922A74|nr:MULTISPECIES: hypothetical protein [unclassified Duganella]SDF60350.1 hypothetical protein SAMN05216320_101707 [Duganella sp. OV458]SDI68413.1 hypothetical protein SAMN05428973_101708 [Duganella sp. OV510]
MKDWFAGERGAYFFLWLGIGLIALFGVLEYRFPQAQQLETARGRVVWQQETRGALYFVLSDKQQLVLNAKGDIDGRQRQTIRDAQMYPVSVQFLRAQKTAIGFAPGAFYAAYGVAVGGKTVLSLDEVRSAYRRDNLIALAMGVAAAVAGAWRVRSFSPGRRRAGDGKPASRRSR